VGIAYKTWYILLVGFILAATVSAGYDEILIDKNKQLETVRKQIDDFKSRIIIDESLLSTIQDQIDSISSELNNLNEFLKNYLNESYLSPAQITSETNTIISLEEEVKITQSNLKGKIINLYKHGKNYELELLMSSKTPNEYLRRNQYLQKFAQSRKKELQDLKSKEFILEEKKKMVSLSTSSRRFYVESKRSEANEIEGQLGQMNTRKELIEYDSKLNEFRIERKTLEMNNIRNFISNFVQYKSTFNGKKLSRISYSSDSLVKEKGYLNLPVDPGSVRNYYGNITDNTTNTQFFNNGIDFSISTGSRVYCVADGTVTISGTVPYYGKVIVISHNNGYKSVYGSLSTLSVKAGDKVRLNQVIGRTGEDPEGQILHFELWHDKTSLNPAEWLRF
jgi:septal ring factor EnvC (AmiA/AmiB activator)